MPENEKQVFDYEKMYKRTFNSLTNAIADADNLAHAATELSSRLKGIQAQSEELALEAEES